MPKIRNTKDKLNNLMDVLVANSERTNKSIESISEQISSLSDLLVAERTLSTKQYRKESILKQRPLKLETANKAFQDELDEIKSKRREIQSEINSILEEERRIQKQERKAEQEKSTYYSRTAKSEFESGNLISGLFLSFLGRNEKTAEEIQEENKQADKEERDLRKKNLIDELTALKEERKQLRNDIKRAFSDGFKPLVNLTASKSDIQENTQTQDMIYEMRDKTKEDNYNKQILDKITTIDVNVTKIEKSLLDLNKNINTTTSNSGIVDLLSSANQLKNLPRLLRPLTQILRPLMNVLSLPVLGGIAGAVASFSGFFSLLNKDQDLYNKRKEEEQKSKVESAKQQTAREDAIIRRDVDIEIQGIEARGTTITPDILESYAKTYEQKGEKKKALAYREKIKELKPKEQQILPPTAEEATYDAADYDMKLEKESEAVMVQSLTPSTATVAEKLSEELPLYKAPVPTKLEQPTVQPTKTFVAKKQNVPTKSSISAPKVGVIKPNMEIGIIDRALGAIGSIIPTSFGSLGTPAMAATTIPPKYEPQPIIPVIKEDKFDSLVRKFSISESQGNTGIINSIGAAGKYQFLESTAMEQVKKIAKERPDIAKKFEGKTFANLQNNEEFQSRIKRGEIKNVSEFIKTNYPDSISATVASLSNEEQEALYKKFIQPLIEIKGKENITFGDIKSYGFASGKYPEALKTGNMNLPIYDVKKNAETFKQNKEFFNWDTNKDGVLTAQELYDATSKMEPKVKQVETQKPNIGSKIYSASVMNKELTTPTNSGTNVIAPQTNIITNNNQSNKQVREQPRQTDYPFMNTFNPLVFFGFRF